jgi:hypothetical protein
MSRHGHAPPFAIKCALAFGRAPRLAEQRRGNRADDGPALLDKRDAHANDGKAAQEIGGPVDWVDDPHSVGPEATRFLGKDCYVGGAFAKDLDRGLLSRAIDIGDVVAGALDLGGQRPRTGMCPRNQLSRRCGGSNG